MAEPVALAKFEDDPVGDTVHHPYSAYNQGWDAFVGGYHITANPYDADTRERRWWHNGWKESAVDSARPTEDEERER